MTKQCTECEGEGTIYVDTSSSCTVMPWSECCGGCGHDETCDKCSGEGEIEIEDIDELDEETDTSCMCKECKHVWNPFNEDGDDETDNLFGKCPSCSSEDIHIEI